MTRKEWANIPEGGIEQETLEWNAANGWTISADRITDAAWPYIKADGEFTVVDNDFRSTPKLEAPDEVDVRAYPPLATAQTAEWLDTDADESSDPDEDDSALTTSSE
jgi:hypothetical protein